MVKQDPLDQPRFLMVAGATLDLPHMGPECTAGLRWAASQRVDYVTVPYVRSSEDIQLVRSILDEAGALDTAIIAQVRKTKPCSQYAGGNYFA